MMSRAPADNICELCGVPGRARELVICSMCITTSRHIYCMPRKLDVIHGEWKCEKCSANSHDLKKLKTAVLGHSDVKHIGTSSKRSANEAVNGNGSMAGCLVRQKGNLYKNPFKIPKWEPPKNSKVKFLPEVDVFESGINVSPVKVRGSSRASVNHPSKGEFFNIQASQRLYGEGKQSLLRPVKKNPAQALAANIIGSDVQPKSPYVQKKYPPSNLIRVTNDAFSRRMAPKPYWNGVFEVFDVTTHIYHGIQAHTPCKVMPEVHEAASKFPDKLKLKLLPLVDVLPERFQVYPPTIEDVGVYFLPSEKERFKDAFACLCKRMNKGKFSLRGHLESSNLHVYSSNMLCQGFEVTGLAEPFLWGVFRKSKRSRMKKPHVPAQVPLLEIKEDMNEDDVSATYMHPPDFFSKRRTSL